MRVVVTILALIIVAAEFSVAQWRVAKGTAGISIDDIDIYEKNPDTLYAFGEKFLRSINRGEHWDTLPGPAQFKGGALRVDRYRRGLSQEDLASILRVDPRTISDWEAGKRQPKRIDPRLLDDK